MSKKKLLEESTIRSFMKLANLQPLTAKFLKEAEEKEDEEDESEEDESEEGEAEEDEEGKEVNELRYTADREGDPNAADRLKEEGKESEGRPASKSQPAKGTSLAGKTPGKMPAAKNAAGDAKLKALKAGTHHSGKPDSIQFTDKSNAPKKNNSTFEVVAESLQEMEDEEVQAPDMGAEAPEAPEADGEMGSAGEGGEHQDKMKDLIRGMLNSLKDMGAEYGMSMEISDEGGAPEGDEEMAPPEDMEAPAVAEDESMMEEKLDEIVEKLTRRVASRLVKESKKKR